MRPTLSKGRVCRAGAFTMLELMIVVAIMGIILMMGLPAIRGALHKESFVQDLDSIVDACDAARCLSIESNAVVEMRIYTQEHRIEISAVPRDTSVDAQSPDSAPPPSDSPPPVPIKSFPLTDQINIQMLEVNFTNFKEEDVARVRFYPNGTSYMFVMVIQSDAGEYRKISLEEVTALVHVTTSLTE